MFDDLYKAWRSIYMAYLDKSLAGGRVMFYYLSLCVLVVAGIYMYLYYQGAVGFAILFSSVAGVKAPNGTPPINILHAIGMILIIRYVMFGGLTKKAPENLENRLREIESKVGELHKLAFGDVSNPEEVDKDG